MSMLTSNSSLERAEELKRNGWITYDELRDFIRNWNAGPHFTQAVYTDGRIRNFDPDRSIMYRHLYAEFGVRSSQK
jgi:hypothetical protein